MADEQQVQAPAPMTDAPQLPTMDSPATGEQSPVIGGQADSPVLDATPATGTDAPAAAPGETPPADTTADTAPDAPAGTTPTGDTAPLPTDGTAPVPGTDVAAAPADAPSPDAPLPDLPDSFIDAVQNPDAVLDYTMAMSEPAIGFIRDGGPMIWAIAALSVITLALILWKIWRLFLIGAWSRGKARDAVAAFEAGRIDAAKDIVRGRRSLRSKCINAALIARETYDEEAAREDAARVAKREITRAMAGLRPLELIATIAPLLGLLGTVLGMITAFQALQEAGSRADPAMLAGGIWEALLTTAAGMAVAIPASAALAWFEGIVDSMAADVEDGVTRIFVAPRHSQAEPAALAAE